MDILMGIVIGGVLGFAGVMFYAMIKHSDEESKAFIEEAKRNGYKSMFDDD